jgi:hypothetical protein
MRNRVPAFSSPGHFQREKSPITDVGKVLVPRRFDTPLTSVANAQRPNIIPAWGPAPRTLPRPDFHRPWSASISSSRIPFSCSPFFIL